jgi:MFS family permease
VEITNGWLGGIVSALGAVSAGWFIRRVDRRLAYALSGVLTAASGVAMALAPHVSASYAVFTLLYGAFTGMAYAAFSAFAFETIGTESVATKYNVLTSLLNLSIVFKTRIDGRAHGTWGGDHGGGSGVLLVDAAMTAGGIALIVVAAALTRPARR